MPRPKPRKRAELPDAGLDPEALAVPEYRREQINVRVTEVELRSIRAVAKRLPAAPLGLSIVNEMGHFHCLPNGYYYRLGGGARTTIP